MQFTGWFFRKFLGLQSFSIDSFWCADILSLNLGVLVFLLEVA